MPVDYKGGELSNLSNSEFHHIIDMTLFKIYGRYVSAVFFLNN